MENITEEKIENLSGNLEELIEIARKLSKKYSNSQKRAGLHQEPNIYEDNEESYNKLRKKYRVLSNSISSQVENLDKEIQEDFGEYDSKIKESLDKGRGDLKEVVTFRNPFDSIVEGLENQKSLLDSIQDMKKKGELEENTSNSEDEDKKEEDDTSGITRHRFAISSGLVTAYFNIGVNIKAIARAIAPSTLEVFSYKLVSIAFFISAIWGVISMFLAGFSGHSKNYPLDFQKLHEIWYEYWNWIVLAFVLYLFSSYISFITNSKLPWLLIILTLVLLIGYMARRANK